MRCECGKKITQLQPIPSCDKCWARSHSHQFYDGELWKFQDLFKKKLMEQGLSKQKGETLDEWVPKLKQSILSKGV
jgi:hypothetical protein